MVDLGIINPENVSEIEALTYPVREAVRAVVLDAEGNMALLHVAYRHYYKLPGGGIEEGEDHETALRRECLEEIGCDIEVLDEIGCIVEYRKMFTLLQRSYCYLARVKGEKGLPHLEEGEIADGFKEKWVSYTEAKRLLAQEHSTDLEAAKYIVPRDRILLNEAANVMPMPGV